MTKTKEELRKSQYDNPEVKKKWREANLRRYAENPELGKLITQKAHEAIIRKSQERFKTNPRIWISKRGYKMIYVPRQGAVKYHHWIWKQANREIPEGMVLHHKDFDRLNNNIKNLILMEKKEHSKLHYAKLIIDRYGRFVKLR
jgi:hypothetical protein